MYKQKSLRTQKIAALILALCMIFTMIPTVYGGTSGYISKTEALSGTYTVFTFNGDSLTVKEGDDTKYEITGISRDGTEYTTEDTTNNLPVTKNSDGTYTYKNTDNYSLCVTINKKGGTYVFTGTGNDMSIAVKKEATGDANILLADLTLTSKFTAPITIRKDSTAKVTITALEGTTNTLTDASLNDADKYGATDEGGDGTNAAYAESAVIKGKSSAQVTLNGKGTLNLNANASNGIKVAESGSLTIEDLTLNVTSVNHGISSDNTLTINSGNITVTTTEGDAIRSNPDEIDADAGCAGTVDIKGGTITIKSGDDAIHAESTLNLGTENGSDSSLKITITGCYEGLEGQVVNVYSGTFDITSSDDGINSAGGSSDQQMGPGGQAGQGTDPGAQAGRNRTSKAGINGSTAGMGEGTTPPEKPDGTTSSGGMNGGMGGQWNMQPGSMDPGAGMGGGQMMSGQNGGGGQMMPGQNGGGGQMMPEQNGSTAGAAGTGDSTMPSAGTRPGGGGNSNYNINIYGGNITVNADGDGLDSNGNLNISGGSIVVWGAKGGSDNEPLDADGTVNITGGTVFGAGSSSMNSGQPSSSSQTYITLKGTTISQGSTITVSNGTTTVFSTTAPKNVNYVIYSSPSTTSSWKISGSAGTGTTSAADNAGTETSKSSAAGFNDVKAKDWFADDVDYVFEKGIMSGTGNNAFTPNGTISRAMLAVICYRLAGSPAVENETVFTDVKKGTWYYDAVCWCTEKEIITGYEDKTFRPNANITREDFAAILYRYANAAGMDVSSSGNLTGFTDQGNISSYAKSALGWANGSGFITGVTDTEIQPKGNATRAQAAAILHRVCKTLA